MNIDKIRRAMEMTEAVATTAICVMGTVMTIKEGNTQDKPVGFQREE